MSEQRKYRTSTAQQKIEIVLAGLRGDRSIKEICRDHDSLSALLAGDISPHPGWVGGGDGQASEGVLV